MDSSTYLTPLPWNGLVPYYIHILLQGMWHPKCWRRSTYSRFVTDALHYSEQECTGVGVQSKGILPLIDRQTDVCDKSFSRKDNVSRHLLIHSEKKFQCHHCSKCYSWQEKLKVHQTRHHGGERQTSLQCVYCLKYFTRDFTLKHQAKMCLKKSFGPTKPDLESTMFQLIFSEKQYRQKLAVGKIISTMLNSNEDLSEESLKGEYKKGEIISTITSSACASVWECYAETMAKEGNAIHSTTYPSRGYFGHWSTGRGRQVLPSKLHQVSLQWSTCDYYWHCY